ncbi:SHOCT domain-containing protein [bacterium]|nr:SHOCT domain-containing protein [bacterium]
MNSLFEPGQKSRSLSIALLGLAALGRGAMIVRSLLSFFSHDWVLYLFNALSLLGNVVFCFAPLVLLLCYLLSNSRKGSLARYSIVLIGAGGLFGLLYPVLVVLLYSFTYGSFPVGSYMLSSVPYLLMNVSILVASPIVFFEIKKRVKKTLPWICLVEASILFFYSFCSFSKAFFVYNVIQTLSTVIPWAALFVMTKNDLIVFDDYSWDAKIISTTEELRRLKMLFETNQISEEEYTRRKAIVLNIR